VCVCMCTRTSVYVPPRVRAVLSFFAGFN